MHKQRKVRRASKRGKGPIKAQRMRAYLSKSALRQHTNHRAIKLITHQNLTTEPTTLTAPQTFKQRRLITRRRRQASIPWRIDRHRAGATGRAATADGVDQAELGQRRHQRLAGLGRLFATLAAYRNNRKSWHESCVFQPLSASSSSAPQAPADAGFWPVMRLPSRIALAPNGAAAKLSCAPAARSGDSGMNGTSWS